MEKLRFCLRNFSVIGSSNFFALKTAPRGIFQYILGGSKPFSLGLRQVMQIRDEIVFLCRVVLFCCMTLASPINLYLCQDMSGINLAPTMDRNPRVCSLKNDRIA